MNIGNTQTELKTFLQALLDLMSHTSHLQQCFNRSLEIAFQEPTPAGCHLLLKDKGTLPA